MKLKLPSITKKYFLLLIVVLFSYAVSFSQEVKGINFPRTNNERTQKCDSFMQLYRQKPKEVKFSIKREGDQLFLEVNDKKWFDRLFSSTGNGIAIDIVSKSRYYCDSVVDESRIRGELQNAIYAQKLRRSLKKQKVTGRYRALVGSVPQHLRDQELEFNILLLSNRTFCQYNTTFNLESYPWELLDMGIYLDSLTYKDKKIQSQREGFTKKYKTLKFTIPFEKNKSEYSPADIQPMYDSLRLTDFNIKSINIKAYSSVEGSLDRNLELQKQRASSIATSLMSFQEADKIEVSSSENWVEFLSDIEGTEYENLKSLSKEQIKSKLTGNVSKSLEPYLKNHRKAIITLELDKIDKYKDKSLNELVELFNKSIDEDNLEKASVIQNSIFDKVKEITSPNAIKGMRVPKQKKYITLLTKNSMIKYLINVSYTLIVKNELEQLEALDPQNKRIKYNLMVLELVLWRNNASKKNESAIRSQIQSLKKYDFSSDLIDRMLVNYHIILAEKKMRKRDYQGKDESVEFILEMYENFSLSNYDYLSLAQFLTYYSNLYDATYLLESKVQDLTVDEDLLFYYLNLTLVKKEITKSELYRKIMLNAINIDEKRFCKLFNSAHNEGLTFQLLEDQYLRKTYCENCQD
jgi:outer membrane protein OmpA-like peptidoglycan-associated protein